MGNEIDAHVGAPNQNVIARPGVIPHVGRGLGDDWSRAAKWQCCREG